MRCSRHVFALLLCLALPAVAPAGAQDDGVRLERQLVALTVTVTDPQGRYVMGLDKSRFEVYDDNVRQTIAFFSDDDTPVTLGIVFDTSGSMKPRLQRSVHALRRFVQTCHPDDEYFLIGFNQRPELVRELTVDGDAIVNSLTLVTPSGRTALYDAVYVAVEKAREGRHQKRALLVVSDGQDNFSRYSFKELHNFVKESDVQIYAIGIVDPIRDQELGYYGEAILEEVTRSTGGRAFFPKKEEELVDICSQIALELRHQYSIGYYPTSEARDGKWHKLKVKIDAPPAHPRLAVRTKKGYYGALR